MPEDRSYWVRVVASGDVLTPGFIEGCIESEISHGNVTAIAICDDCATVGAMRDKGHLGPHGKQGGT